MIVNDRSRKSCPPIQNWTGGQLSSSFNLHPGAYLASFNEVRHLVIPAERTSGINDQIL